MIKIDQNRAIKKRLKSINYNQNYVEIRSKLRSSTQIHHWISNKTKIDDRIWISNLIWWRWFNLECLIALAYPPPFIRGPLVFEIFSPFGIKMVLQFLCQKCPKIHLKNIVLFASCWLSVVRCWPSVCLHWKHFHHARWIQSVGCFDFIFHHCVHSGLVPMFYASMVSLPL